MKRMISAALIILCILSLAGCADKKSGGVQKTDDNKDIIIVKKAKMDDITLGANETEKVLKCIADGEEANGWVNDVTDCAVLCSITVNGKIYTYSSDCGIFNDLNNTRSLKMTTDGTAAVNSILSKYFSVYVDEVTEPRNYYFEARYIRTDGYVDGETYPKGYVIDSRESLDKYFAENELKYDFAHKDEVYADTTSFADAIEKYDEAWFETHQLIIAVLEEGSGSIRHEVQTVTRYDDVMVEITRIIPEAGTDDMAEWHILIELDKWFEETDTVDFLLNELT